MRSKSGAFWIYSRCRTFVSFLCLLFISFRVRDNWKTSGTLRNEIVEEFTSESLKEPEVSYVAIRVGTIVSQVLPETNLLSDLYYRGNIRSECGLEYDCVFERANVTEGFKGFDAVLVSADGLMRLGPKLIRNRKLSNTLWVYHSLENKRIEVENNFHRFNKPYVRSSFNWTVYFGRNATINRKYFSVRKVSTNGLPGGRVVDDLISQNRSKKVCIVMSNCALDFSGRVPLANSLVNLLPSGSVHVWGKGSTILAVQNIKTQIR